MDRQREIQKERDLLTFCGMLSSGTVKVICDDSPQVERLWYYIFIPAMRSVMALLQNLINQRGESKREKNQRMKKRERRTFIVVHILFKAAYELKKVTSREQYGSRKIVVVITASDCLESTRW